MNRSNNSLPNSTNEMNEDGQSSIINLSQALEQKKKDQKLPGWFVTQQISEKYNYERYIEITLKELIIYIIFYVLLCFAVFSYSMEDDFYYQYIIKRMYEDTKFRCGGNGTGMENQNGTELISMTDVRTMEHYWCFMQNFLVASFHWKFWYSSRDKVAITLPEDDNILFNNYLVGVPRIRQDEFARRNGATQEEAEEFLRDANVTKKNAAFIPKEQIRSLMRAGGAEMDKELNMRVFQLEKEMKRLMQLNARR
ncbi:hypothetical protein LSTR_LSTR000725 [Laodelphax striatellus]|uniref:Polycystin domain-containing protein n=1 Tax=Laodelphax striatellus TaxID=195883 RepID=A0A482XG66_LAOST|nr:hypothetical protein LSTR_LSTR000725 [Laodelphax striatellus]